jgi:hypothetical protein
MIRHYLAYFEMMRLILSLSLIAAIAVAGPARAGLAVASPTRAGLAVASPTRAGLAVASPTRAGLAVASPARDGGHHTAEQLTAALLTQAELPEGYVRSGGDEVRSEEFYRFGSEACTGEEPERVPKAVTRAWIAFEGGHGATLDIEITTAGPELARQIVGEVASIPAKCPTVRNTRHTAEHSRLPLPDLGLPAAGLVTEYRYGRFGSESAHRAVVACGGLSLTFDEISTDEAAQARFTRIVVAGAKKLKGVGDPC